MIFIILKNKILFIFERCKYNNNKILILKNLSFLPTTLFIVIIRLFKSIVKNKSNENKIDIKFSKNILYKKKLTLTFKEFKKIKIKKFNFVDIVEINVLAY